MAVSLAQMRTRVRRRADMERSTFVSDSEINQYINDGIKTLYDLLVQKFGQDYYTISGPLTSFVADQLDYDLPADFYKETGVDLQLDSDNYITAKPFMWVERNRFNTILSRGVLAYQSTYYKILGNKIRFTQQPGSSTAFRIWYVPLAVELNSDSDTFDGYNGWEKYVEILAAIDCKEKEESDTTALERQLARLEKRIEDAAENRQAGIGQRVTDVRSLPDGEIGFYNRTWW